MIQHGIFKLPALLKELAKNRAIEVAAELHTPLPQKAAKKQSRLLTFNQLETLKGISYTRQHIGRLEKANKFPERIKIGSRIFWYEHEVDEWIQGQADARWRKSSKLN